MAKSEFTATRPLMPLISWALMTLNPNHPTARIQLPRERKGMLEMGMPRLMPSDQRPMRCPRIKMAGRASQPPNGMDDH